MAVETLAWGFGLIEGPRPDPEGGLYFSDVVNGGVRYLDARGNVTLVVPRRRGVGGIALHADGGLVISGRDVCHVREGQTRKLFGLPDVGGFNDVFTDAAGRLYTGSMRDDPFTIREGRRAGEAYRIDGEGQVVQLYGGVGLTNGIGFSPDGRRLYHVDSAAQSILVHDVRADGEVDSASRATFARVHGAVPDGLAVDAAGGVWVALYGGGGVTRYLPSGEYDRTVAVPARAVTSLCFAGADLEELIVVTADNTDGPERGGSIFRVSADDVGVRGLPAPLAKV